MNYPLSMNMESSSLHEIMKRITTSLLTIIPILSFGQGARVILNNDAYITFSGGTPATPIYMVVENPNANAITTIGTGGNIVSEGEWNIVRWMIGNNTGTYTVPYNSDYGTSGQKMPLTLQITGAGSAGGLIDFSTYETATDFNTPWASRVDHMLDAATATVDNSLYVVDRWWIMDNSSYATRPSVNMTIGYCDFANELIGSNLLIEANLVAQRWNDPLTAWQGDPAMTQIFYGGGTLNMAAQTLGPFAVPGADFHETWVLVDRFNILPVELLSFEASCEDGNPKLIWSTASENNNDYFTILRSSQGQFYQVAGMVDGAGNASSLNNYEFVDTFAPEGGLFYKIEQTDIDGRQQEFAPVTINCDETNTDVFGAQYSAFGYEMTTTFHLSDAEDFTLEVFDDRGRAVWRGTIQAPQGVSIWNTPVNNLADGIYMVVATSETKRFTKKLFVDQ